MKRTVLIYYVILTIFKTQATYFKSVSLASLTTKVILVTSLCLGIFSE